MFIFGVSAGTNTPGVGISVTRSTSDIIPENRTTHDLTIVQNILQKNERRFSSLVSLFKRKRYGFLIPMMYYVGWKLQFKIRTGSKSGKVEKNNEDEIISVMEEVLENKEEEDVLEDEEYYFPLIKDGDGSQDDVDGIPTRFLLMQKGNRLSAKLALEQTLAWRKEYKIDRILKRPHVKFDKCKAVFPHCFAGFDLIQGCPIFIQQLGNLNTKLMHKNNITNDDIINHYIYTMEYCWNFLDPNPNGLMLNVLDLSGPALGWNIFRDKNVLGVAKSSLKIMSRHYPSRSYKTLIVNAPNWFTKLFHLFKPLLRDSTKRKIEIFCHGSAAVKNSQNEALRKYLGDNFTLISSDSQQPALNKTQLEIEQELRSFCITQLQKAGLDMEEVVY